ncbi:unnamed protein product [Phytophthora fragariaefolia]|uniref:Unnamed protein product n=1 Tax=Phytophthora fragariaefolia TaxID=1490495 RepID=A0A9W6X5I9_9STRA|nr:unnamed protein product [Phytophthora fragariaefolia]
MNNNDEPVPMEIDNQTQMVKRNAPKYNNSGNSQGRKPRMNMVLEEDDQADTILMDRVTMHVADIQEQADGLQAFMDKTRVKVEETVTAASNVAQETDLCGLQSGFDSGLHAMQPEMVPGVCETPPVQAEDSDLHAMLPNLDYGVCGSPPEQEAEFQAMQPVTLVQYGSQPTSLASNVLWARLIQAQRFDGTLTPVTDVKHVEAPVSMDGYFFLATEFGEWKLLDSHDDIFGKPWFQNYNPQVNWQMEEVVITDRMQFVDIDGPSFSHNLKKGEYKQVFRVKVQLVPEVYGIPEPIFKVVGEYFKDVFPEQLPDGLRLMREFNFEVALKKPSSRVPLRLSKICGVAPSRKSAKLSSHKPVASLVFGRVGYFPGT